jgi:hypothetical protein
LIVLARYPGPDVRGTVTKHNTSSGFVLPQEKDGVTIGEDQIPEIQDRDAASRLGVDQLAQLVHVVRVKVTADREHNRSAARAMNLQHRPPSSERNCQATRKVPEPPDVWQTWVRRNFDNGEMRDNTNVKNALARACESGFY